MGGYRAVKACFFAVVLASCVTTSEPPGDGVAQADDAAIPPDYRELIVQTISARTNVQTIRSARISHPTELWVGLVAGGNRRAICVEVLRETLLGGSPGRDHWVFTFKNGRVWTAAYSYQECESYSPFNELLKQKRPGGHDDAADTPVSLA
jgi:hypothetical protein